MRKAIIWGAAALLLALAALGLAALLRPDYPEVERDGVILRCRNLDVWPAPGEGRLEMAGKGLPDLELLSPRPLLALYLVFGSRAPAKIFVEGGRVGERTFRPDGGVTFQVLPAEPRTVRPLLRPWERRHAYRLRLLLPEAPDAPLGLEWRAEQTPPRRGE